MDFPLSGVIPVDKPPGVTSRQVVDAVARACGMRAVGHAGTLDPLASGVVVVCVGHATKLVEFLHQFPKRYQAVFLLGRSSPSDDLETPVEEESNPRRPSAEEVAAQLPAFRGDILQRPCDYSAVHVRGQRAYHLARKGRSVDLPTRAIRIYDLDVTAYEWPRLAIDVECSTGTFIRALGRDLAESLGTQAVMESLVRTAVGPFGREASVAMAGLRADSVREQLLPTARAVPHLPQVFLSDTELESAVRGGLIAGPTSTGGDAAEYLAAFDSPGEMVGILKRHTSGAYRLRPNFRGLG